MRKTICSACHVAAPTNDSFEVVGRTLCRPCAEQFVATRPARLEPGQIKRLTDPTVCAKCGADAGTVELPTIVGAPMCETCNAFYRNRPYPTWLKWSFVGLLCLAVAAFIYNWRFFAGYVEILRANRAIERGDVQQAAALMESASQRLPEIRELAVLPNLFKAAKLINEDKNDEALQLIQQNMPLAPPAWQQDFHIVELQAGLRADFDRKNYDGFLSKSQELFQLDPQDSMAAGSVASAYACKYAIGGNPNDRLESLRYLDQARQLNRTGNREMGEEKFADYEARIQHRLATRTIVTAKQFHEQFPNGWKPAGP